MLYVYSVSKVSKVILHEGTFSLFPFFHFSIFSFFHKSTYSYVLAISYKQSKLDPSTSSPLGHRYLIYIYVKSISTSTHSTQLNSTQEVSPPPPKGKGKGKGKGVCPHYLKQIKNAPSKPGLTLYLPTYFSVLQQQLLRLLLLLQLLHAVRVPKVGTF